MITRGTSDLPSAPTSPSSRTYIAPSDSVPQPASSAEEGPVVADKVDVIGTEEPRAEASARRTTEPAPLRPSKRLPAKLITGAALAEARKGKKTLIKRTAVGSSAAPPKKPTGDGERASDAISGDVKISRRIGSCEALGGDNEASRTSAAAPDQVTVDMAAQLYALKAEVQQIRALVAHQTPAESSIAAYARGAVTSVTSPNAKGEIPPAELCYLTTASFPEGAKKAKGDYNPPQAHLLAASRMFRSFGTETVGEVSRDACCAVGDLQWSAWITWPDADASSEGAALEDGSTNSNFSSDCSPSANLPTATLQCASYEDILVALHGLNTFGHEVWYDHMCKLVPRLRSLVAKSKSAGPANTPARVRLTLLFSSMFLSAALGHMQADDPQWWSGFCETLRGIDYQSPVWTLALVSALTQPAIPESMHRLIPINRKGQEPCLLSVAELPYSGGSQWIDRTYGARGQAEDGCQ
ncbi:hypothetical protein JG688_00005773 [Phytophthora aleatoria]|uniref:Uncharacterized protein n=1 Tax=Phytophthora aleatoria TaxID=2496075 RepID=A0A8J5IPC6_9STRA|nr:hypothetical protein JG688_00005773 [Phytophthora aleatoria]